jgi:hypothetical protein
MNARWWKWTPAIAAAVFLTLACSLAYTKAPWCDEGWWVNPAYDLAFHGRMGMSVVEPTGQFINANLHGLQERTYTFPPAHFVALAGWFRLFGFSTFLARLYSIFWSLITLAALFYILRKLFPDARVAPLALVLVSMEFIFLWSTADSRPDAMANCLATCSVALYLRLREGDLGRAIFASQMCAAAGVFAHFNALVVVIAWAGMVWYLDRARLKFRHLLFAGAPYLLFASAWSVYILEKPADFAAQFFPQAGWGERWKGILRPDIAIGKEIDRHLAAYCIDGVWTGVTNGWAVLVPLLYLSAAVAFVRSRGRLEKSARAFGVFAALLVLATTFLNGFKGYFYLIYVVPIYCVLLAAWLLNLWARSAGGKWAAAAIAALFAILQLSTSIKHIRADEYHRDFVPAVERLEQYRAQGKSIMGTAALGFGMNFTGFKDDIREGNYSGLTPDVLVIDRSYRNFAKMFEENEPQVFAHLVETLSTRYRLVSQYGSFWIFERTPAAAWLDAGKIEKAEKGKRAECLFRMIFTACKLRDAEESSL